MTLKELYDRIGGNYDHAVKIMRMDRMIDRYVRKLEKSQVGEALQAAGATMDAKQLFESAHAMKGVCSNLGLDDLAAAASEIAEEFRPGTSRTMSDDTVKAKLAEIDAMYTRAAEGIREYSEA